MGGFDYTEYRQSEDKKDKSRITLNIGNVHIPLDEHLVKAIEEIVRRKMNDIMQNNETMKKLLANAIMNHKKYLAEVLKPVVKTVFDDVVQDLRVKPYWDD